VRFNAKRDASHVGVTWRHVNRRVVCRDGKSIPLQSPHSEDFRSRQLMRCKDDSVYLRMQNSDSCPSTSGCSV